MFAACWQAEVLGEGRSFELGHVLVPGSGIPVNIDVSGYEMNKRTATCVEYRSEN